MRIRRILPFLIMFFISTGLARATVIDNSSDLIVPAGETYTLDGSHTYTNSVQIDGTLYVTPYDGTGTTGSLELIAPSITINGTIGANGKGYPAASGPGRGGSSSSDSGGGGGYGGDSGNGYRSNGGTAYGSITEPTDLGSGGGSGYQCKGGVGGGAVKFRASGTLTVNGIINANGNNGGTYVHGGGGGSGGSIYIVAGTFAGSGSIVANGGNGGGRSVSYGGGGGSGGRIAVYYSGCNYSGVITANGGTGYRDGGAGTIFMKSTSQTYGDLLIDNNNNEGVTPIVDGTYTFDSVLVKNKAKLEMSSGDSITSTDFDVQNGEVTNGGIVSTTNLNVESGGIFYHNGGSLNVSGNFQIGSVDPNVVSSGIFYYNAGSIVTDSLQIGNGGIFSLNTSLSVNNLTVLSGGVLTHSAGDPDFNLIVANDLTIEQGGSINVDGKGYQGGLQTQKGNRNGDGPGGGKSANNGGGAGYGGNGGELQSGTGGIAYGSITQPVELGSGGGGGYHSDGGDGGGAIHIDVSNTLTINGTVTTNGGNVAIWRNYFGGGGSGGSIYIVTKILTGNGCIRANGGDGTNGGAGGRVAIYHISDSYTGTISAYGGKGYYKWGGAGTIFTKSTSQNYGDLLIDNNNNEGVTSIVDGTYIFDSVGVKNKVKLEMSSGDSITSTDFDVQNSEVTNEGIVSTTNLNVESSGIFYHNGGSLNVTGNFQIGSVNLNVGGGIFYYNDGSIVTDNLQIGNGGIFSLNTSLSVNNLTVLSGGFLIHSAGDPDFNLIVANDLTVEQGGSINVDKKGYQGGLQTQIGTRDGDGPGGGKSAHDGGGAGYGGNGGELQSGTSGIAYGSITQPAELGSGGGGSFYSDGGEGGGCIRIQVSNSLTINGTITANGESNIVTKRAYGSGGSGGSIYIVTNILIGNGRIRANGGDGTNGGAGGRIAIYYTNDSYTGTISAYGGKGYYRWGGAGTIFTKSSSQTYGDLLIDNNNIEGVTSIVDGTYTFDSVRVKNKAKLEMSSGDSITSTEFVIQNGEITNEGIVSATNLNVESGGIFYHNGGSLNVTGNFQIGSVNLNVGGGIFYYNDGSIVTDSLQIGNGGIFSLNTTLSVNNLAVLSGGFLIHSAGDPDFNLIVANDLTIEQGGSINVTGKGHLSGEGPGKGSWVNTYTDGSGAGYGGEGGRSAHYAGGTSYGSITEPTDLGSGGGGHGNYGGRGGGVVKINVSGTLRVDGRIIADGGTGRGSGGTRGFGGGGSGGSIYIIVKTFAGSGLITANGGSIRQLVHPNKAGGGGGGRIAIYYQDKSGFLGVITVMGGSGYQYGQEGTIYLKQGEQEGTTVTVLLPDGGNVNRLQKVGAIFWEKEEPINASGEITISTSVAPLDYLGKLYFDAVLNNSLGQKLAEDSASFYITDNPLFISFSTDKKIYKPTEPITVSGEVKNSSATDVDGLTLLLQKDGLEIFSDIFDLPAGQSHSFSTIMSSTNSFTLKGIVTKDGSVLTEVAEYIEIVIPQVEMVVTGPDVVGEELFDLGVLAKNTGKVDADLTLDFAGEISTMTLTVGESRLFQRSFVVSQDTTFQINLSGDVEKSVTKVVKFGGEIILSLEPEEVYAEGTGEVPFTITNSGSVDMELEFAFSVMKGTIPWAGTESRTYYLPAWGGVFDSLIYENMDEGNYVLEYKGLVSGSALIRVAKFNVVEIEELIVDSSQSIDGKMPVEITVENVGANDFVGSLRLDTGFFKENKDLNLNIGETKIITFNVGVGVACGGYEAIAQVLHNGDVIAEATESFVLMPVFSLVLVPSALSFDVGQQATVAMTVKNTGAVGGTAEVSLTCGDIVDQSKTMWLDAEEERELSFSFTIADDLWERDYAAVVELRNLESGLSQFSEIPLHINGYNVSVSASLDKDLYTEAEIAKLTLEITNGNPQFTPTIFARVIFNSYSQTTAPFVLETASSLEFDVPVHFSGQKISYGIYTESGRALYLNSIYIYEKGEVISLLTDKQVYNMGETIAVTIMPETTGYFEISAPNCVTGLSLSTTEQFNLSWNLPEEAVSGTYSIDYSLEDVEGSHRFDVIGYSVRILEANLDKERYLNGEKMSLRLRIDSNRDISMASFKGWVLSLGDKFDCFDSTGVLKQGESTVEIEGEMLAIEKGVARLVYTISKPLDGGGELLLVSGAEGFDVVLPDETPPVSEIHIYGPQYVDAITTHTYVSSRTTFTITAVDPEVDAFASGVANIYYRINVSTLTPSDWKVYTSSFSISGEDGDYVIEYYSIDNMDNEEEIKSLTVTVDNTPPETVLISPSFDSEGVCKIFSGIFPVIGTADGEQFDGYELAFASGTAVSLDFLTIKESTNPVTESELGLWDTTGLEQGYYTLRLSAWDKVENLGMSTVVVFVGEPEFLFAYTYTPEFEPAYIAIDGENYSYVTNHRPAGIVVKFDSLGNVVEVFGRAGGGGNPQSGGAGRDWRGQIPLAIPEGIAIDSEGNMWVADRLHNRVVKLDSQGNLLMQIGGVGFGRWDGSQGVWGQPGEIAGHCQFTFNWPVGVAVDGEGNIYVADRFNNRIQKFTPEGELIEEATIYTGIFDEDHSQWRDDWEWWKQKPFYRPGSIALDGDGNIYVADQFQEQVLKFSPLGELVMVVETGENPDGIIVTGEGYVYVTNQGNNRIQKFDKYGNFIVEWGKGRETRIGGPRREVPGGEFDNPGGIACDSDGDVYVVDRGNGRVQVFGLPQEVATQDVVRSVSRVAADVSGPDPAFKLGEVYSFPNPAKRGKWPTIHFESGIADRVEINIYDIAGELVHSSEITDKPEIVNDKYAYEYRWNVSNVASGVYIYLIRARKSGEKEIKVVKKLAVVK